MTILGQNPGLITIGMYFRDVPGQKIAVMAWDELLEQPKTGDAANITAKVSKDGGTPVATSDLNPGELSAGSAAGIYIFNMTQDEMNADLVILYPSSATANVSMMPVVIRTIRPFLDDGVSVFDRQTDSLQAMRDASATVEEIVNSHVSVVLSTTIATVTNPLFFTISEGSTDDRAYDSLKCRIRDRIDPLQTKWASILDYNPTTKEIILLSDQVPDFVVEAGDYIDICDLNRVAGFYPAALDEIYQDSRAIFTYLGTGALNAIQQLYAASPQFSVDDGTFTPTATQFECDLTGANDNIWKNQVVRFRTGTNVGLFFRVTASQGTSANPNAKTKLTVNTMPFVPADGDAGIVFGQTGGVASVDDIGLAALQKFVTVNTGFGSASTGSVAELSQGAGGAGTGGGAAADAAAIWSYGYRTLTQSAAQVQSVLVDANNITLYRGDTIRISFTGLGDVTARVKTWFTIKEKQGDPTDSGSTVQITEDLGTAGTGVDGLQYIVGTVASVPANGSITVVDDVAGDIDIFLDEVESAKIPPHGHYVYDLQILTAAGESNTLAAGLCEVVEDVTRATS